MLYVFDIGHFFLFFFVFLFVFIKKMFLNLSRWKRIQHH